MSVVLLGVAIRLQVPPSDEAVSAETLGVALVGPEAMFYLLDAGAFGLAPKVAACFFNALGGDDGYDDYDDRLRPSQAGHLADWALLKVYTRAPLKNINEEASKKKKKKTAPFHNLFFQTERFLAQALRSSPRRTRDPARASVFVVGFPVYLSFLAATEPQASTHQQQPPPPPMQSFSPCCLCGRFFLLVVSFGLVVACSIF